MGLRYLALGDSYTIGEDVAPSQRWPVQLAARLQERGIAMDAPQIIARTGWTTDELWYGLSEATLNGPFELVSLLIGVNNQYRERGLDQYRIQFGNLLRRSIRLAGNRASRVLVVSIPDWGCTPFGAKSGRDTARIARELDAFNLAARKQCEEAGVVFVDITPISRQTPQRVADDELHPSGAQYALWVQTIQPHAEHALGAVFTDHSTP